MVKVPIRSAEGDDRGLVGEVDDLAGDVGFVGVRGREGVLVTAGRDDLRSCVPCGDDNRAGDPATAADDEHALVL